AGHDVPAGARGADDHAEGDVTGDDVALQAVGDAVGVGADAVERGGDVDAAADVAQGAAAADVGADAVAGDDVVPGAGTVDRDAHEVAGDEVALDGVAAAVAVGADDGAAGAHVDGDAGAGLRGGAVGHGEGAAGVGADEVAGDDVAHRAGRDDADAVAGVAG